MPEYAAPPAAARDRSAQPASAGSRMPKATAATIAVAQIAPLRRRSTNAAARTAISANRVHDRPEPQWIAHLQVGRAEEQPEQRPADQRAVHQHDADQRRGQPLQPRRALTPAGAAAHAPERERDRHERRRRARDEAREERAAGLDLAAHYLLRDGERLGTRERARLQSPRRRAVRGRAAVRPSWRARGPAERRRGRCPWRCSGTPPSEEA